MAEVYYNGTKLAFASDSEAVCFVASLLEISEYRLFQIAHLSWFGSKACAAVVDSSFSNYLKFDVVPFWLRDMVRKVLRKFEEGNLKPHELGIKKQRTSNSKKKTGWAVVVMLIGIFIVFNYFLSQVAPF